MIDTPPRINGEITAARVQLLDQRGLLIGELPLAAALAEACRVQLDLVEVDPSAEPPRCQLMAYWEVKELRLRPATDANYVRQRVAYVRRWLEEGRTVIVRIWFRSREVMYRELAERILTRVVEDVADVAEVAEPSRQDGRSILVTLHPAAGDPPPS